MTITQIGIDIGKNTFHVIGLDGGAPEFHREVQQPSTGVLPVG